jgi:hypothetical protein
MSLRVAQAIAAKDLRTELRSRSTVSTVLPFAVTMLLAFGFALGPDQLLLSQVAAGLLWLAALFASVELCHRSYQAEAANGALEGLLLSPADKGAVFLGKTTMPEFVQLIILLLVTAGPGHRLVRAARRPRAGAAAADRRARRGRAEHGGQPARPARGAQPEPPGGPAASRPPPGQPGDHRGHQGDRHADAGQYGRDRRVAEPAGRVRRGLPRGRYLVYGHLLED